MDHSQIIENTRTYVKNTLRDAEGGHDWFHIQRVYNNARLIAQDEVADDLIVALGSLLHDIADYKFHNGDERVGPKKARDFLRTQKVPQQVIDHVVKIIENISYKGGNEDKFFTSIELGIVQDADRLDALGAIGIARTFNYGGYKNRPLYDPEVKPDLGMTTEQYKASNAPTINHFYEKLLLLKERMNTSSGRKMAEERHLFMEQFLKQFFQEWGTF